MHCDDLNRKSILMVEIPPYIYQTQIFNSFNPSFSGGDFSFLIGCEVGLIITLRSPAHIKTPSDWNAIKSNILL